MKVKRYNCREEELQHIVQLAKDEGERILAIAPIKVFKGVVKEFAVFTGVEPK